MIINISIAYSHLITGNGIYVHTWCIIIIASSLCRNIDYSSTESNLAKILLDAAPINHLKHHVI